jgi:uncharacterized protein (DUF4213/DUF364 family)
MLINDLHERLADKGGGVLVQDVRVGLGYTAVRLDTGACGLAYTFRDETGEGCSVMRQAGSLAGRQAKELAAWAKELNPVTAAIGLATLNALVDPPPNATEADIAMSLRLEPSDVVGMVGYFGPLVEFVTARASKLHIFERRPTANGHVLPDWAAPVLLPECGVVLLSATTIANRTADSLLECARQAREDALLGPSTPMVPEVFAERGVTLLSGVQVFDADRLLRIVSEGGGTQRFGTAVRKLVLHLNS